MELTQSLLKEFLHYDPDTGIFTWVARKYLGKELIGAAAGSLWDGYVRIKILGKQYRSHRLAFLYMGGAFPVDDVDHINGVRDDNRWSNLRQATRNENSKNRRTSKANASGVNGVHYVKRDDCWRTVIGGGGKRRIYLGSYRDRFDAICARKSAELRHGYHENHGMR